MGRTGGIGRIVGVVLVALALLAPHVRADVDKYEVYAVRFATLANFPVSSLVAGADRARRMDIAMMIWVVKGVGGRVAIVDSGFHRDQYFRQFTVKDYENLDEHTPIAQTLDAVSNLRTQDRMRSLASEPRLLVPGHDPAVFARFPHISDRIVRITVSSAPLVAFVTCSGLPDLTADDRLWSPASISSTCRDRRGRSRWP